MPDVTDEPGRTRRRVGVALAVRELHVYVVAARRANAPGNRTSICSFVRPAKSP